jgi:hypothetical protein
MRLPQSVVFGRMQEFAASVPEPELIAYTVSGMLGENCVLKRFNSRKQLEMFCKSGSKMHALVKTPTHPNFVHNTNIQRADATIEKPVYSF